MKDYLGFTMTNGSMPEQVSLYDLESYVDPVTHYPTDYFCPGALKDLLLPPGIYRIAGTDFRVVLNSRISAQDITNARAGVAHHKKVQAIIIEPSGAAHSLTPHVNHLSDGRDIAISGTGASVFVTIGAQQYTLDLSARER